MKNLKQKQALIGMIESMVLIERTFSAIESLTKITGMTDRLSTWFSVVVLMGVDLYQESEASDKINDDCADVYFRLVNSSLSVEDTAIKIYEELVLVVDSAIQEFPSLKVV